MASGRKPGILLMSPQEVCAGSNLTRRTTGERTAQLRCARLRDRGAKPSPLGLTILVHSAKHSPEPPDRVAFFGARCERGALTSPCFPGPKLWLRSCAPSLVGWT